MSEFRADLHTHSTASDGTYSPAQLIELAKERGLQGISITDHDTLAGYDSALFELADRLGICLLIGVEFSSFHRNEPVHILGYALDLKNPALSELVLRHQKRREKRNRLMIDKLRKEGFDLSYDELEGGASIGRPHIANLMVKKGYVSEINEAFKRYLGNGKKAYVNVDPISISETIDIIHSAKGKAFLAHPHLMKGSSVKEVLKYSFDGMECYYARFQIDYEKRYIKMAKERRLLISGGSDFHGDNKLYNPLGASWTDEESFNLIQAAE
ncbi:MAG: PHP domain-containing protein [Simkaniaceae bacterium]